MRANLPTDALRPPGVSQSRGEGSRDPARSGKVLRCLGQFIVAFSALLTIFTAAPAEASRVRRVGLGDMIVRADRVFGGRCVGRSTEMDPVHHLWVTTYTFAVTEPIKGVARGQTTFRVPGSPEDPLFDGLPAFDLGEEALLLLYPPSPAGFSTPMALGQGCFRIVLDERGLSLLVNGTGNDHLLADIPEAVLRSHGLHRQAGGPFEMDRLVRLMRTLAGGTP